MVFWSYLLLGSSATPASIDNVLAPLVLEPQGAAATSTGARVGGDQTATGAAPLVEQRIDQLDLLAELERLLTERLQPAGRLQLLPTAPLPVVPASSTLPEVELVEAPSRLTSSSLLLRYRLSDGDRQLGLFVATFRVQVLAEVWMPNERLAPGAVLDAADFSTREVDLIRESRAVPADRAMLGRYEISRAVTPDRPLTWNDVAPRSLVHKGAVVDVVATEGMLSVSMKGQATRSGALGEIVVIRNLQSKREFSAEVIDENKVRVHF